MATSTADEIWTVYKASLAPPLDHIAVIRHSPDKPATPARPTFGFDSIAGLLYSNISAPLYLYATLRGKFAVWDDLLAALPDDVFRAPTLDIGCGRGLVLLKVAARKKDLAAREPDMMSAVVPPAYGTDIFSKADQTGNDPTATYRNAAAVGVLDYAVLHEGSFTESFPFADGVFSLITSSLAIHNVAREGRRAALAEIARVCAPGGKVIIVDLYGFFKDHVGILKSLGWEDVRVVAAGLRMMYGILPCQILQATKPK
jgi:SAM-dependent methyltransferase